MKAKTKRAKRAAHRLKRRKEQRAIAQIMAVLREVT